MSELSDARWDLLRQVEAPGRGLGNWPVSLLRAVAAMVEVEFWPLPPPNDRPKFRVVSGSGSA